MLFKYNSNSNNDSSNIITFNSLFYHQAALDSFSRALWTATDGKVYLGEVKVVVPSQVSQRCGASLTTHQATWHRWAAADLTVSPGSSHTFVKHGIFVSYLVFFIYITHPGRVKVY